MNKIWRLWAKSLGAKEGNTNREADIIAILRTIYVLFSIVVGVSIISNNWGL